MQRKPNSGARRQYQRASRKRSYHHKSSPKPLDYRRFVHKAVDLPEEEDYCPIHQFADFDINSQLKSTLDHLGFSVPTAIQDQSIPAGLEGRDVIGLANTGTGKTLAFLLPIIEKMQSNASPVSTLILAPTRELAQQIDAEFCKLSRGQRRYSALLVGGMNINQQIRELKRGPHLIIGTPGRVKDLIGRRILRLQLVETFVLDEADRMCDMGFIGDIRDIVGELSPQRQTFCYSATMTEPVKEIVSQLMSDPVTISVGRNQTVEHIDQDVVHAKDKAHRMELLVEVLRQPECERVIVFGETKYGVQRLADNLTKCDIPAVAIHGNKSQPQRDRALAQFKKDNNVNVLVATDVAARGIDVKDVSHVINFDPPRAYDDYIHRIGRTGRAGKAGKALTFITGS